MNREANYAIFPPAPPPFSRRSGAFPACNLNALVPRFLEMLTR